MSDEKTVTLPGWVTGLGKYLGYALPMLFTMYIAFHDLQQDFVLEQAKTVALTERVTALELKGHQTDMLQAALTTDLKYIRETMDRVEKTMERLAER